jgi:7-keto-8-aminopelargonate synthetase-like enzyme
MNPAQLYASLKMDLSLADQVGFNPYYQKMARAGQGKLTIGSDKFFDLASNDYLGLAIDPRVIAAMVAATQRFGSSFCGTPIAAGYAEIIAELEAAVPALLGLEAAVVFPSCYQANASLFTALADAQDVIIVDHYAHASLIQGIKASGARVRPFLHNQPDHLEKQLSSLSNFRRVFVVTESVFSTEGSIAPLAEIVKLCRHYDATPIIDDSHGLGVIGPRGRGILEHAGLDDFTGIYTASLGKALANTGGVVAGKHDFIEYLRYNCPGLMYSTALVPASAGGVLAAIAIIKNDFSTLGAAMRHNHQALVAHLIAAGFRLSLGAAPIAAVQCGSSAQTISLAKLFFENGILATPFIPPSVPPAQGVLRLIIGAKTDDAGTAEIGRLVRLIGGRFFS